MSNRPSPAPVAPRVVHLHDLPEIEVGEHRWRPVRRALGLTAIGAAVFAARAPGDALIEPHDETSAGAGAHEELYVVLAGRARFTVGDAEHDAPAGTLVAVPPGVRRAAVAAEPGTEVLVVGAPPGASLPVSPFEHWYAALGPLADGDPGAAADVAAAGLADHPGHGQLHYQVACFAALAGQHERALAHLRDAVSGDERAWTWLVDDPDLDALRALPGFPRRHDVDGMRVEEAGTGPAVVLVHAGIADRRMWNREWRAWPGAGRRVVRLDLHGFGRSTPPAGVVRDGADLLRVLDALGIERAVLVGASFGGGVVLDVAAARPERVAGLVLAGARLPDHVMGADVEAFGAAEEAAVAAGDLDAAAELNVRFWLERDGARRTPLDPEVRARVLVMQREALALQADLGDVESVALSPDVAERLGGLAVPALVLVGEEDVADFQAMARRLAELLPDARLVVVPGAAHLPTLEAPEACAAPLEELLGRAR